MNIRKNTLKNHWNSSLENVWKTSGGTLEEFFLRYFREIYKENRRGNSEKIFQKMSVKIQVEAAGKGTEFLDISLT